MPSSGLHGILMHAASIRVRFDLWLYHAAAKWVCYPATTLGLHSPFNARHGGELFCQLVSPVGTPGGAEVVVHGGELFVS
jgi:hypothetical protein